MKEFWKDWKKITPLEKQAIKTLKSGEKIILKNIPKKEIIAIYVKGSFVRREMNEKSDVDTLTIVKSSKTLPKLRKLEEKYRDAFKPQIQFSGYSIWELKNNKRSGAGKKLRASPSRAVVHLDNYKLIYGKPLKKEELASGTEIGHLKGMINAFKDIFLPGYKEKKMGFSEIVKQVFWLVEFEQRARGKIPPNSWKKLAKLIKDKDHIIYDTLRLRLHPTKDKKIRRGYITKLKGYLKKLDKTL